MKYCRSFEDMNGVLMVDHGETPKDQVRTMSQCWIEDANGIAMNDSEASKNLAKAMVSLLEGRVLEIGYGMGFSFELIRKRFPEHDVIDIDEEVYSLGENHFKERFDRKGLRYVGDYKTDLKLIPSGFYDSIFIDANYSFLEDDDARLELIRLLKPGGCLVPLPKGYPDKRKDLPRIKGFRIDKIVRFEGWDQDPVSNEKALDLLLRRKNQMHKKEKIMERFRLENFYSGVVGRYRKTRRTSPRRKV